MYTIMRYEDFVGARIDFIGDPDPDGFIATNNLEHSINSRNARRGKNEADGSWPSYTFYESVDITLEGSIVAGSAEQFQSFLTYISQILMPQPLLKRRDRNQGTFTIRNSGNNAIWEIPVSVQTPLQVPKVAGSPSRGDYHLAFVAFRPYYYEPKTNRYFWPT